MLKDLLLFARSKPADETYVYSSPGHCPIAQFLKETGLAVVPNVGVRDWNDIAEDADDTDHDIDPRISEFDAGAVALEPHTWGALAQRLEFEDFLDFARTKNPTEFYDYVSNGYCAFAQYLRSIGVQRPSVVPSSWRDGPLGSIRREYDKRIDRAAVGNSGEYVFPDNIPVDQSWGSLVKRMEHLA